MTIPRLALVTAVLLAACAGTTEDAPVAPFVGTWNGTKTYLSTTGEWLAEAPDWTFVIETIDGDTLRLARGPLADVRAPRRFEVRRFVGEPTYPPLPSGGGCAPITPTVTGGVGVLEDDGTLVLDLNWSSSCGGSTTESRMHYEMRRIEGVAGDGNAYDL